MELLFFGNSEINSCLFKPLAIYSGYTALFVSDLVINPKDKFSSEGTRIEKQFFL